VLGGAGHEKKLGPLALLFEVSEGGAFSCHWMALETITDFRMKIAELWRVERSRMSYPATKSRVQRWFDCAQNEIQRRRRGVSDPRRNILRIEKAACEGRP
jgi:hypothetical protein